ncbi:tripartite tricarboxylate transporter substrate binding protein [Salinicola lusitanus]|uniref:Tripartite tricarboxylate transporter substrate binding protein n=2 Tax=Salinicola lusitanus TaxID=1949085 RepID=A0ABZ3CWP6_9GAMM|nr:tripartite tricarboxylate transporter substrate binding protein [Salinicola sp. CR57]
MKTRTVAIAAIMLMPLSAMADYPERAVQMIIGYSAGGGTDIAARTLAPYIEKELGTDITVINRPGAGGEVGFTALANAEPDGYTIGFINTPNVLTIPIERDTRYELSDFQPVASVVDDPDGFNVGPDSEFASLEDLVAYAKEHPGEITYGTTGVGSDDHLAALALERLAGIEMTHVPFPGAADVRQALMGGHIEMGIFNIGEAAADVKAGRIKMLAQAASQRSKELPDVPTTAEAGYELTIGSNRGIAVPAGVPDAIVQKLSSAIEAAMNNEEFQKAAAQQSLPLDYQDPTTYQQTLQDLQARFQTLWDESPWSQ